MPFKILKKTYAAEPTKAIRRIVIAASLAAAVIVAAVVFLPKFTPVNGKTEEGQVLSGEIPLSSPDLRYGDPVFPENSDVIIVNGADVEEEFCNLESNPYFLVFEIAFADTKEILYISSRIAPGNKADGARLTKTLAPGEYEALLIYRAYATGSSAEIVNSHKDITIIVM